MEPVQTHIQAPVNSSPPKDIMGKVQKGVITGFLLLVGGIITTKVVQKLKQDNAFKNADSEEVQQAIAIRSALNPSGVSWLSSMDSTDLDTLYQVAGQITNIKKVVKQYKNLYQRSMMDDLQKDLEPEEYQKFLLLQKNQYTDTSASTPDIQSSVENKGKYVLTIDETKFYKDVKDYLIPFTGHAYEEKPGRCIGTVALSESVRSYKAYMVYPVTLIKVYIKTQQGHDRYIYVDQDDIKMVTKTEYYKSYKKNYPYYRYADKLFV